MELEELERIIENVDHRNINDLDLNILVAQLVAIILADDDDDDDREPVVWAKITVDMDEFRFMEDSAFRLHFRMSRTIFEDLLLALGNHTADEGVRFRGGTELDHILMMTLWLLATPDSFRSVALRFGVTPGVLHFHYKRVIGWLCALAPTYIAWPTAGERQTIQEQFERNTGFPGIVGAIDGTHIYVIRPQEDEARFVNRHGTHSILMQGICDNTLLFRDIYVGEPGSLHDSRVFRRSHISALLLEEDRLLGQEEHILGDGAYILTDKLLTPFRNMGHLTEAQQWYNICLASGRVVIEQAFALLKGKWRRLKYLHVESIEYAIQHIVACVMLHNFLILQGEPLDDNILNNIEAENEEQVDDPLEPMEEHPNQVAEPDHPLLEAARVRGVEKRLHIVDILFNHAQ